jgi:hypothetical protein
MRALFTVTAVIEAATGLALVVRPSEPVALLLGSSLDTPAGLTIGRIAGAALLALGVACWQARSDARSRATTGLIAAMLLYNVAAAATLAHAGLAAREFGVGPWPGVVLHAVLAAWCAKCVRDAKASRSNTKP